MAKLHGGPLDGKELNRRTGRLTRAGNPSKSTRPADDSDGVYVIQPDGDYVWRQRKPAVFVGGPLAGSSTMRTSAALHSDGTRMSRGLDFAYWCVGNFIHMSGYVREGDRYVWYPHNGFILRGGPCSGRTTISKALVLDETGYAVHPKSARTALAGRNPVGRYIRRNRWDDFTWTPGRR